MKIEEYQKQCEITEADITKDVIRRLCNSARSIHHLIGMLTELGELADIYKRHIFYGQDLDIAHINEELGDCCFYVAGFMNSTGISFGKCVVSNNAKLRQRYPKGFTEHDALNRNLKKEDEVLGKE